MDVKVKHTDGGLQIQAEACGIERGTDLQRVTDAVQAVRDGMGGNSAQKNVTAHVEKRADSYSSQLRQVEAIVAEQVVTIEAKDVAIKDFTAERRERNVKAAHLTQTLQDYEGMIDRGEETRKSLQDKVDGLKLLLKVARDALAASVKKHKATSRRLSTANKKLRNLNQ